LLHTLTHFIAHNKSRPLPIWKGRHYARLTPSFAKENSHINSDARYSERRANKVYRRIKNHVNAPILRSVISMYCSRTSHLFWWLMGKEAAPLATSRPL